MPTYPQMHGRWVLFFWASFGSQLPLCPRVKQNEKLWHLLQNTDKQNITKQENTILYRTTRSHNPEVVGSSPASATIKPPFSIRKRWFFFAFSIVLLWEMLTF